MSRSVGKIDKATLQSIFAKKTGAQSTRVRQGPAFGVDTALIDLGDDKGLVVASDPMSYIPSLGAKESAYLSVVLTANDIATSGFLPEYAQFVLNLPHTLMTSDLEEYWHYIHFFCKEFGISITGGHTGFDDIGKTTLAGGGTMFAHVQLKEVKSAAFAKGGEVLIQTKTAAFSSSAILAKSFSNYVQKQLGDEKQRLLADSFYEMDVLKEVQILKENPSLLASISAMHDVTEGGVLGAVYELCAASGLGVEVFAENILLREAQKEICQLFEIDPLRSVGAGSLLISCQKEQAAKIIDVLKTKGIEAAVIGELNPDTEGKILSGPQKREELIYEEEDPYWNAFFKAMNQGLK